jgi:hypothetical protein
MQMMMGGPSESVNRYRFQTAFMLLRLNAVVVSDKGKGIAEMSGELKEDERK